MTIFRFSRSESRIPPSAKRFALGAAAAALTFLALNCTFITARTDGQCFNDGECRARGAQFADTRCSSTGTCEVITLPEASIDAGGPCQTNSECNIRLNTKARCAVGQCVALVNPDCTVVDGDPTDPNAIFVGVMTPRIGTNSPFGLNEYVVASTAAAELKQGSTGQSNPHSYVTIGCDEIADPVATATFLTSQVKVSALFGPVYDKDFEQVIPIATLGSTFLLGSRVDDPSLPTLAGIGANVWSWAPNRTLQVQYFQNLINILEPSVKTTFGITTGDIKIAFAVAGNDDISSSNFATAVTSTLTFNGGKTVAQNGSNFVTVPIAYSNQTANTYTGALTSLIAAAPNLVVVTQENDLLNFVNAVAAGWTGPAFPRFLFLTEDTGVEAQIQNEIANSGPGNRFAGKLDFVTWSTTAQEQSNSLAFSVAYRTVATADPEPHSNLLYDSFYENAYAFESILKNNGNEVTAIDTGSYASAISLLNAPGTPVNVGVGSGTTSNISQMATILSAAGDPDLDGASGPLEFNTKTGSPVQDAVLDCIKANGTVTPSGVTFSGSTGAATGSYTCL